MDAVDFFKTANRICEKQRCCKECPIFYKDGRGCIVGVDDDAIKSIEKAVPKVEQWAKGHPVKTRQSEFFKFVKALPDAKIGEDEILDICPCNVGASILNPDAFAPEECEEKDCDKCKREYWLAEGTDND